MTLWLTTSEAAKVLDRSADTVRLYERIGKLPAQKTKRGQRLFSVEDVEHLARELARKRCAEDRSRTDS
jgi:excisionase family DNA binding protein